MNCADCDRPMHGARCACGWEAPKITPVARAYIEDDARMAGVKRRLAEKGLEKLPGESSEVWRQRLVVYIKSCRLPGPMRQPGEDTDLEING